VGLFFIFVRSIRKEVCVRELPPDLIGQFALTVGPEHTADALGNHGMQVLATPYVVWMIEAAGYAAVHSYFEDGEGVVGAHIDLHHRAPTAVGQPAQATVRLTARRGRRLTFQATVESAGQVVADGTYESVVLDPARILARAQQADSGAEG
jgi:fluoroacetyl-CoA thioesterase